LAKDWRLAICTRWRPLVSLILVCLSLLSTVVASSFVYTTLDEYPMRRLERRIHKVKLGMTVAELESILGLPNSRTDKVDRKNLNLGEGGGTDKIVEYAYSAVSRYGESWTEYKGILVDENMGKVVSIRLSNSWGMMIDSTFWSEYSFLVAIGLMILVVLVVMLLFRKWCQSITESEDTRE